MTMSDYERDLHAAWSILEPLVAAIEGSDDTATTEAEQIRGWVDTALNNEWIAGLTPRGWAERVALKFGWDLDGKRNEGITMSFKPEVQTDDSGKWYGNGLRFATEQEAVDNARDLMGRWLAVRDYRASESPDPVNYRWTPTGLESVETDAEH